MPGSILMNFSEVGYKGTMIRLCTCITVQKQEYGESAQGHGGDQVCTSVNDMMCSMPFVEQRVNVPGSWRRWKTCLDGI